MHRIMVIHGPNLNLIGTREPDIYGSQSLEDINQAMRTEARELDLEVTIVQTNHEGELVEEIQKAGKQADALIINPAAYTHTSVAILDAVKAISIPAIEVHMSNVHAREDFRHHSYIAGVVAGRIMGFGAESYLLALRAAKSILSI
ncbi:type II 3-dehydroquinate dehydratase [bacterium]|nr:type II 3-dehydroquinate dehydratase [bacterium]